MQTVGVGFTGFLTCFGYALLAPLIGLASSILCFQIAFLFIKNIAKKLLSPRMKTRAILDVNTLKSESAEHLR